MKKIVVFTGAGVSADSGIATFRSSDGLWAQHRIEDVCTPEALVSNRAGVIDFYNKRRKELLTKTPNDGHRAIVALARFADVEIITQNIDDMHERASEEAAFPVKITHLHGELRKLRSCRNENATVPIDGWEQQLDARHSDGGLLRPFVVFFGESVPMLEKAIEIVRKADILIVVGTSLAVYPAASLIYYIDKTTPIYLVDPGEPNISSVPNKVYHIKENSVTGLPKLVEQLKEYLIDS